MAEFRRDPIDGKWVIIAPERRKLFSSVRPEPQPETPPDRCPFCVGNESLTPPELFAFRNPGTKPDQPGWRVRVIPNRAPILRVEVELEKEGVGYYDKMSGMGANEIIIETPDHKQVFSKLPVDHLTEIYLAYRQRILDLKKDRRMKYVLIFKNYGKSAGAMMDHPHSQLIALPILPKQIAEEIRGARDYYEHKERCIFCDIVHQEIESRARVVFENKDFLVMAPWAPIFPFELWVLPRGHRPVFEESSDSLIHSLAESVKNAMVKLDIVLEQPNFNLVLHTNPFDSKECEYYHWHFEILPRLTQVAGFEYGSGFFINPVPPEQAADYLRRAEL